MQNYTTMRPIRKSSQLLTWVLLILLICRSETLTTVIDMHCNLAWFDTLGFPDLANREYVRVATGYWRHSTGDLPKNTYLDAFLLNDEGQQFTVFTIDLRTLTFTKTSTGVEEYEKVGYEALDLHNEVTTYLEKLRQTYRESDAITLHLRLNRGFGDRSELFVLARACAANNLERLAYEVYTFALTLNDCANQSNQQISLREVVENEIAYVMMWRNVLSFEDISVSRSKLLERFEQFVENFSESKYMGDAQETVTLLRQMIDEDEEHAKKTNSLESMTLNERITELIFQLRDQNGHQLGQPGWCSIFSDARRDNAANQLVEIGYPAVPQLIAVLDDEHFTRSVGFHRDFYFSHHVLRVGDAALAIIERVAGRSFYRRYSTTSEMVKDGEIATVKAEVETWWHEFQEKGEKRMLLEAVAIGDHNSPSQARLLAERYPHEVLEAITKGLGNADKERVHRELVAIAAGVEREASIPLLLSVLDNAPYLSSRVTAAEGLQQRGRSEGVTVMIEEWSERSRIDPSGADSQKQLAEFLANSGDPEAIRALDESLHKWPVDIRYAVISTFRDNRAFHHRFRVEEGDSCNNCESLEVSAAIEGLLIHILDDTEEYIGLWMNWDDKSFYSPRICDLAGHELSQRWPGRYKFNLEASLTERDQQLAVLKNVWCKLKGFALLPLPQRPEIPRVPDEVLAPLLERVMRSPFKENQEAIEEIETLGLGALPALRTLLNNMEEKHNARPILARLAGRLANIVREVIVTSDSVEPDQHFIEIIEALEGKPLTSEELINLLFSVTQRPPPGSAGIEIHADRAGDDTGIVLRMRLIETIPQTSSQRRWVCNIRVIAGDQPLGGYGNYTCNQTEEDYKKFVEAWDQAQEVPSEEMLRLRLSIVQEH